MNQVRHCPGQGAPDWRRRPTLRRQCRRWNCQLVRPTRSWRITFSHRDYAISWPKILRLKGIRSRLAGGMALRRALPSVRRPSASSWMRHGLAVGRDLQVAFNAVAARDCRSECRRSVLDDAFLSITQPRCATGGAIGQSKPGIFRCVRRPRTRPRPRPRRPPAAPRRRPWRVRAGPCRRIPPP